MSTHPTVIAHLAFTAAPSLADTPLSSLEDRQALLNTTRAYIKEAEFYNKEMESFGQRPAGHPLDWTFTTDPGALKQHFENTEEKSLSIYMMDQARAIAKGTQSNAATLVFLLAHIEQMRGNTDRPSYLSHPAVADLDFVNAMNDLGTKQYACRKCKVEYVDKEIARDCCTVSGGVGCLPECRFPDTCGALACCEPVTLSVNDISDSLALAAL